MLLFHSNYQIETEFSGGSKFAFEVAWQLMMIDLPNFLSKHHSLHIVKDNLHVVIPEETQNSTSFVVKDSTGRMAFVVVDDVGYLVPAAVEADVDVTIDGYHAFRPMEALLPRLIEENAHLRMT